MISSLSSHSVHFLQLFTAILWKVIFRSTALDVSMAFMLTSTEVVFLFSSLFAAHGSALAPVLSGGAGVNGV